MTPEDLAQIHALAMTTRPWSAAEFARLLNSAHIFLVEGPRGFALGRAVASEAELLTIAVAPKAQRQGLGRRLLADFQSQAATRDATRAFLEVAEDNLPALALYQAAGWITDGRRPNYYPRQDGSSQDAILMSMALGQG